MQSETTPEFKKIHFHVYNPANSIFKSKATDRAQSYVVKCSNSEQCPLLKRGECVGRCIINSYCPYAKHANQCGPTKRAKGFYSWIGNQIKENEGIPSISSPAHNKFEFIGEYVYLPYVHMTMNESISFLGHSGFMSFGRPFLPKEYWNLLTIQGIINFRPQALFGGEITDYQLKEVPKFLTHLKEKCPDLFKELVDQNPAYVERYKLNNRNFIGRKALLKSLVPPFEYKTEGRDGNYQVVWNWDGEKLTSSSKYAYNEIWGEIKNRKGVEILLTPDENTAITVQNNDWVGENTIFFD